MEDANGVSFISIRINFLCPYTNTMLHVKPLKLRNYKGKEIIPTQGLNHYVF